MSHDVTWLIAGRDTIDAPPDQAILEGTDGALNCSHASPDEGSPDAFITWLHGPQDTVVDGRFSPAAPTHEGQYTCDIFVDGATIRVPIMLFVVGESSGLCFTAASC